MASLLAGPMSGTTTQGQLAVFSSSWCNISCIATATKEVCSLPRKCTFKRRCDEISRRCTRNGRVVLAVHAPAIQVKPLSNLPFKSFISRQGKIHPVEDPETVASVFAVYERNRKIQYIGFSKDLRNSLRTLMGRRPELCYFYKVQNLTEFNPDNMLFIRQQWIKELGYAPPGNDNPDERAQWEQPCSSGSISDSAMASAAASKAKSLQLSFQERGLKEEMIFDPELMKEGKLNILPSKELTPQELANSAIAQARSEATKKDVTVQIPEGGVLKYEIIYELKFKTNGGWMYDIAVNYDDRETRHRIIVGKIFPDAVEMPEDEFLEIMVGFLLYKQIPRHTEGQLDSCDFNINYFSAGEAKLRYNDLQDWFSKPLPEDEWRFVNNERYGVQIDPAPLVGPIEFTNAVTSAAAKEAYWNE